MLSYNSPAPPQNIHEVLNPSRKCGYSKPRSQCSLLQSKRERENPGNEVGVQCVQQQRKRQKSNKGVVTLVIDNNNFAGAARFLVHLLPVPARLRLETS